MTDKQRVLFVDDDPKILSSFARALDKRYDVVRAASGEEGLVALSRQPVAVVVSDLRMTGMDGISFLAQVKERWPQIVRIVLTGYADFDNAINAVNDGYVFRFLQKPCTPEDVSKAVDAGIEQYMLLQNQVELKALKRLQKGMEGIVQGFSSLVDVRDPYTSGHQRNVTELALSLGHKLGLDNDSLEGLRLASLVHDIGKLYVPAEFLNKPGHLSDVEFAVIKAHPQIGYDILSQIDFPWPIAKIVLQHHERLDGTGYPQGLSNGQIMMEARILAVADVIDAMTYQRPYRPALGIEVALGEIRSGQGVIYDARVVEACLELEKNGKLIVAEV